MFRRDFVRSFMAAVPLLGLPTRLGAASAAPKLTPLSAWLRYVESPSPQRAAAAAELLPATPGSPLSADFSEAVDRGLLVLEDRVRNGEKASAFLAFRIHASILPGGLRSSVNYVIGRYINVNPEHFLELLAAHPHLIGNSKILLNLGLDFVDNFEAQDAEALLRLRSIESVDRPDLGVVQREVIETLYSRLWRCRH